MTKDGRLTIAYTPDSDDAFYYYALETGRVPMLGYLPEFRCEPISALNQAARTGAYAVTASLTPDDRRNWERDLLARYIERFAEKTGVKPDFNLSFTHYRQQIVHALAMWTITLVALLGTSRPARRVLALRPTFPRVALASGPAEAEPDRSPSRMVGESAPARRPSPRPGRSSLGLSPHRQAKPSPHGPALPAPFRPQPSLACLPPSPRSPLPRKSGMTHVYIDSPRIRSASVVPMQVAGHSRYPAIGAGGAPATLKA